MHHIFFFVEIQTPKDLNSFLIKTSLWRKIIFSMKKIIVNVLINCKSKWLQLESLQLLFGTKNYVLSLKWNALGLGAGNDLRSLACPARIAVHAAKGCLQGLFIIFVLYL